MVQATMRKKTIRDIEVDGLRILVRVDFNVPLDMDSGAISDDRRLRATFPTLRYLTESGARVILCSHLGRPQGIVVDDLRLGIVADRLFDLLGMRVGYVRDCIGPEVEAAAANLKQGEVLLLENLRFHPEEEANDPGFARKLADLADVYVNDAFGVAHRAHASTEAVARQLPAVAGLLMEAELLMLTECLEQPKRPFAAVVGGAKISTKIGALEQLLTRADLLLTGGTVACTFLRAQGIEVGASLVEVDTLDSARNLLRIAKDTGKRILLPDDAVVARGLDEDAAPKVVDITDIEPGWMMLDIGPATVRAYERALKSCRTVLWNGPMGVFERPKYAQGTLQLANIVAALEATTVVGGGETAAAIEMAGVSEKISHVSTGGGATLEFIEGKHLPGVDALLDLKVA